MKKILHFFALIVAIAIPQWSMAETYYGIQVAGTRVTSDNASNITDPDISSGKVTYDASTNTLTLTSVTMETQSSGIYVTSSAPDRLHIVFEGNNVFKKVQGAGVAVVIYRSSKATGSSSINCYIEGTGTLTLQQSAIMCMDGPWLCIGNGTQGSNEGYGCVTINAEAIYCKSNSGNGIFSLTDGCVNLSGFSYGTVYGFRQFYAHYAGQELYEAIDIYTPEEASYDLRNMYLADQNGAKVTGPVYMGWQKLGLRLVGTEVTAGNYMDIKVNPEATQTKGYYHYNPSGHYLFVRNITLSNRGVPAPCIESDLKYFDLYCEGNCLIEDVHQKNAIDFKGEKLTFSYTNDENSSLTIRSTVGKAIDMTANGKELTVRRKLPVSVTNGGIHCNDCWLHVEDASLNVSGKGYESGGIQGISKFTTHNATITTPGVYYHPLDKQFYKKGDTTTAYTGDINITKAEKNYGIEVCGVDITEHNCDNVVAPFIEKGTIKYDTQYNQLTLKNVVIDAKDCPSMSALLFNNAAHTQMQITLEGKNTIRNTNSYAICFYKPDDSAETGNALDDFFNGHHYNINGTGWLTIEDHSIQCRNGAKLTFGGWAVGDSDHGGCTVFAKTIESTPEGEGSLYFTDCMVTLTGNSPYGTITGFKDFGENTIRTPKGAKYDRSNYFLADANGNMVTGEVYIGWEKYGLKICGMEINEKNKDDIRDVLNDNPTIVKREVGGQPDKGSLTYNPTTKTLTMKDVGVIDTNNEADPEAFLIENTGNNLIINCSDNSFLIGNKRAAISTTKSLEFRGSAFLNIGSLAENINAIQMEDSDQSIKFNNCNVGIVTYPTSYCLWASPKNKYRLYIDKAKLTINGRVTGIDYYSMTSAGITTPEVYIQPAKDDIYSGYFCKFGEEYNDWQTGVTIQPATENYGIRVSGHELNNINCENFYFEDIVGGKVKYDPITNFLWFDNVKATCTQKNIIGGKVVDNWHPNGINVTSKAKPNVRIIFSGENIFSNIDGVGISAEQNTRFEGWGNEGLLDFGNHSIVSYNGSDLQFTDGCLVKAQRLYGSEGNGGTVEILGASLLLSGNNSLPTIRGISNLFIDGAKMIFPEDYTFTDDGELQVNGASYKGEVYICEEKSYGIYIGMKEITNLNQDDVLGDGTVSFMAVDEDGINMGYLYLNNAQINSILAKTDPLDELTICLNGTSTVNAFENALCALNTEIPLNIVSEDGKGKLILNNEQYTGFKFAYNSNRCRIEDCEVEINAGEYGIYAPYEGSATGTYDENEWIHYAEVTLSRNNYNTRLTVNTQKYGGSENLKNISLYLEGDYVEEGYVKGGIVQPADAILTNTHQIVDAAGNPLSGEVLEIVLRDEMVSVDDITELIDRYLEPGSNITIEDITNLIDLYLEQ